MAKRMQEESGEERVSAKSRPMMNLLARTPSFVSSSNWEEITEIKIHGNQNAGKDGSGRPDEGTDLFEASEPIREPSQISLRS